MPHSKKLWLYAKTNLNKMKVHSMFYFTNITMRQKIFFINIIGKNVDKTMHFQSPLTPLTKLNDSMDGNNIQPKCNETGVKGNEKVLFPISLRFTPVSLQL